MAWVVGHNVAGSLSPTDSHAFPTYGEAQVQLIVDLLELARSYETFNDALHQKIIEVVKELGAAPEGDWDVTWDGTAFWIMYDPEVEVEV